MILKAMETGALMVNCYIVGDEESTRRDLVDRQAQDFRVQVLVDVVENEIEGTRKFPKDSQCICTSEIDAILDPCSLHVLASLSERLGSEADGLRAKVCELSGAEFNLDSPKQVGEVLFERLGLPRGRRTKIRSPVGRWLGMPCGW